MKYYAIEITKGKFDFKNISAGVFDELICLQCRTNRLNIIMINGRTGAIVTCARIMRVKVCNLWKKKTSQAQLYSNSIKTVANSQDTFS